MALCSPPTNIPVSPPSYEEAIQTAAPEIPAADASANDEPPPSYSEATKDDVVNPNFPSEVSEPPNSSDLTGLIIVSIERPARPSQGRQSRLLHQIPVGRTQASSRNRDVSSAEAERNSAQLRARYRKKWSVCMLGAAMGVFLVAGLIAASVLRHSPSTQSKSESSKLTNFDFAVPTIDPSIINWIHNTPQPFDVHDVDRWKNIANEQDRQHEQINKFFRQFSTPKPFNFRPKFQFGSGSDFGSGRDASGDIHPMNNRNTKVKQEQTFEDMMKQLSLKHIPEDTTTPSNN